MFSCLGMTVQAVSPIPSGLPNGERALASHGDFGRLWLEGMWRGDPLADAVVADGSRLVRQALAEGIDAVTEPPPALVELFAALDSPPRWLERDRCERAAGHLARQSRELGLVLGAASLVAGAQNALAGKPLALTGRYVGDAAVRSIEVATWLIAVTTPGGLDRHGRGFQQTVRVRMIHAHVRAHLSRRPDWRMEAWGLPIPQPYMAFTLAEFCSVALRAMARLGVRYTDSELQDIHHLWRYVGHLVGVERDLLPAGPEEYARIESLYALTSPGAERDDRAFVAALTDFQASELARTLPSSWTRPVMSGLQRAFVGDAVADDLAIPDTLCKHLPRLVAPLNAAACGLHDRLVPGGKDRRTRRAFAFRLEELERLRGQYGVAHELVDDLP